MDDIEKFLYDMKERYKDEKLFNDHYRCLNFTIEEQSEINDFIIYCTELYISSLDENSSYNEDETIDFDIIKEDYEKKYFEYGLNLIWGGITPELIYIMLDTTYEKIIDIYHNDEKINIIRLKLLFVKQAIKLLCVRDVENYLILIGQCGSNCVPTGLYKEKFIELNMINKN